MFAACGKEISNGSGGAGSLQIPAQKKKTSSVGAVSVWEIGQLWGAWAWMPLLVALRFPLRRNLSRSGSSGAVFNPANGSTARSGSAIGGLGYHASRRSPLASGAGKAQSVFNGVRFSTAYCASVRNAGSRSVNFLPAGVHLGIMLVWSMRN